MAGEETPKFHNDMGVETIRTGANEFECIGALPPFDHPHVYLDMTTSGEVICPYCSTRYVHDSSLKAGEAEPSQALFKGAA